VGTGKGEVDIVASTDNPITEGSLQSETYSIEDDLFYDDGVTTPITNHWINSGWTVIRDTVGTTLKSSSYSTYFANKNGTSTSEFDFATPFIVELDIIEMSNSNVDLQIYDGTTNVSRDLNSIINVQNLPVHLKVVNDGSKVYYYLNDNINPSATVNATLGTCRVGLRTTTNGTERIIKWKDFKVYLI
jgi:hypothetical protein